MIEIGRNEVCPCGSGKKYKKCCDLSMQPAGYSNDEITVLKLNKWMAYQGKVGRERAAFCNEFIKNKYLVLKDIKEKQLTETQGKAETISCRPGCVYCCYHYITGTLDEVEAVVYYLYQNEAALNYFLGTYRNWKVQIDANQSLLKDISQSYNTWVHDRESVEKQEQFHALANQYLGLNIPCPFLRESACLIYPVRPWVCAGWVAVTPPDWCRPDSPDKPKTMSISYGQDMNKIAHYRNSKGFWTTMPKAVFSLIQGGTYALAKIPGLASLEKETMEDPEIQALIQRLK
jgi:Fe-S-cluster containining protein